MLRHIINTVATALAVMYLAIGLQLPAPQIAMVCVFIVMQPQAKSVLAKGFYRLLGTIAGAIAAWALSSLFASSSGAFLVALGVWVSLLTIIAAFSAQLRAYSIVLTGYTPLLIGIPAIARFGHLAADAAARLAEVGLGIACAAAAALLAGSRNPAPQNQAAQAAQPSPQAAVLAGLYPALAMLVMAALWLATSWRGGAMATLNATVDCALVALAPRPLRAALQMSIGTLLAVAAGLLLHLCYPMLGALPHWLPLAPALALGAWLTARPETLGAGLGYSITLCMLAWPGNPADGQHLHDAAGLALSVIVLSAVCALLSPYRQRLAHL